jgi:hypothetical protein
MQHSQVADFQTSTVFSAAASAGENHNDAARTATLKRLNMGSSFRCNEHDPGLGAGQLDSA